MTSSYNRPPAKIWHPDLERYIPHISKYRLHLENIAEMLWGRGNTKSYKTNRKGAKFYTCSRGGGYVIDTRCLTLDEIDKVESPGYNAGTIRLYVEKHNNEPYVLLRDASYFGSYQKNKAFTLPYELSFNPNREWISIIINFFDKEFRYKILHQYTDIRVIGYHLED